MHAREGVSITPFTGSWDVRGVPAAGRDSSLGLLSVCVWELVCEEVTLMGAVLCGALQVVIHIHGHMCSPLLGPVPRL